MSRPHALPHIAPTRSRRSRLCYTQIWWKSHYWERRYGQKPLGLGVAEGAMVVMLFLERSTVPCSRWRCEDHMIFYVKQQIIDCTENSEFCVRDIGQ